jgi:glutathione peroxidase
MNKNFHDYTVKKIDGKHFNLAEYKGKTLLVVNVASECGLTPQYEALEKLYEKYQNKGLEVLGFPANEFGAQEPGSNSEIQNFCVSKFGVKFPMFEKIVVKGEGQHPLFNYLTHIQPEAQKVNGDAFEEKLKTYGIHRENKIDILWNFEKFLVNKNGEVIARFAPDVTPDHVIITKAIESSLK